jgi:lipopolysaccharide/colanic/teichoic acid biosynthesis glycosyltransferase
MTPAKRLADIALALLAALLLAAPFALLLLLLWATQGRPLLHVSERMLSPIRPFRLVKLRTMTVAPDDHGVSGGDKQARITPLGHHLRRMRLDEIPQLWNILRGEMSFVGPRPPLRQHVERFPDLFANILQCRPGLTGLATLCFHAHEARLLSACRTPAETEAVYLRRCLPRKARLDLIYRQHRSLRMDLALLAATFLRLIQSRRHHP